MKRLLFVILLTFATGCADQTIIRDREPENPIVPDPIAEEYRVEFRVLGQGNIARIVYGSTYQGTSEVTTALPWTAQFRTDRDNVFLYIYAQAQNTGVIRIQIIVDGEIFREAASDGFYLSEVEVSGTYVR